MESDEKMPFTEHLEELRKRLIVCFIAVGVGFCGAYAFKEYLFEILKTPLGDTEFITTSVEEGFFTYLKVAFLAGVMVSMPVVFYEFWAFVAPGLYEKERRTMIPIVVLTSFFFVAGALFGYFIVFPFGFKFLLGVTPSNIIARISMKQYFSFASKLLFAFGIIFELPIIITLLAKLGIISVDFLKKNRKYAVVLFFIIAAILTPPDVVTQILMAIPLLILYEVSILGAKVFGKKKSDEEDIKEEEPEENAEEKKGE